MVESASAVRLEGAPENHHAYRPDIAGLRAVAVLPILLFHAGLNVLAGGFVGVDIFFVISGFLITGIIVRDLSQGRFLMLEFYRRRVARIFPALILVLICTLAAGAAWMLPTEIQELGLSAGAAAAFVSNFHFLLTTDYFGGAAESKPLLHTWSLAVEEQFYVFYPILMILVWKWARKLLVPAVIAVCIASFALALAFGQIRPDVSFYMFPTRAWELGIGALVALGVYPKGLGVRTQRFLAILGLALISMAIVVVRPNTWFPAPAALLPTIGAALLLAYGRNGPTSALLSSRPFVWIGDISYSLYLWHWPIITFYRLQTGVELNLVETGCLIAASIAAAAVTRLLVEEPFRKRLVRMPRSGVVVGGVAALVLLTAVSLGSAAKPISLQPLSPEVIRIAALADYDTTADYRHQFRKGECFMGEADKQTFNKVCLSLDPDRQNWVIFGDSHAAQYWRAFAELWPEKNVIQATASGCRPLIDSTGPERCTAMVDFVLSDLLRPGNVDGVVLAGRWRGEEVPALLATVREVKARGLDVVVIGPTVEYDGDLPLIMARAQLAGSNHGIEKRQLADRARLDRRLGPLVRSEGATYVSQFDAECPEGTCIFLDGTGSPIHFDYGHLTLSGARILVRRFSEDLP